MYFDLEKITAAVANGDVKALEEALEKESWPEDSVPYGYAIRATVARIALLPRMSAELGEFALELALPWVDIVELAAMVGLSVPSSGILSGKAKLKDVYDLGDFSQPDARDTIDEMDDVQLSGFLAQVYANQEDADGVHPDVAEAAARKAYELSMQSDLNYFFGTGQKALFSLASMIPNESLVEDPA